MKLDKKNIFKLKKINNIDKKKILLSLKEHKYVILRGLFRKTDVDKTLNNLKKKFKHKNDKIRPPGKYDLIKKNYQRFMFGITGGLNKTNPRYFRVFYNPLWSKDIYNGRNIFLKLNKLQNYFYGLEENYGEEKKKKPTRHGLYVASRFQQYPSGGGFLAPHTDDGAIRASKELKLNLHYNLLLVMTKKGRDFKTGGGFVINQNKIVNIDDFTEVGDVIVYSAKTVHGVLDIDPHKFPDLNSSSGRYVALTTLFKW